MNAGNVLVFVLFITSLCSSQNTVDIKLVAAKKDARKACFSIQLRSPHGQDISVAGQNYRIFYDASKAKLMPGSIVSHGHPKAYTEVDLLNTVSGSIGFLSLSTDGRELNNNIFRLSHSGEWVTTTDLCFERLKDQSFDLTWAHPDRTAHFASASVAISEWITAYRQQVLETNEVVDFKSDPVRVTGLDETMSIKLYPNPVVDFVNVQVEDSNEISARIIIKDIIGREVVYDQVRSRGTMVYDLTNWPEGVYRLEILDEKGAMVYTDQLIKARP